MCFSTDLIPCSMEELSAIKTIRKTGNEQLLLDNKNTGITLIDFWKWSVSDLISNATRGRFAEYLVGLALGIVQNNVRNEWDAYDFETEEGIKIEVKSAAYIQTWGQKKLSNIAFSIKHTRGWDANTGVYYTESKRQADVHVFCLLHHNNQTTINPLNLNQWEFYVCPTHILNEKYPSAKSISLNHLKKLVTPIHFDKLKETIKVNSKSM